MTGARFGLTSINFRALPVIVFPSVLSGSFVGERVHPKYFVSLPIVARSDPVSARDKRLREPSADSPVAVSAHRVRLVSE